MEVGDVAGCVRVVQVQREGDAVGEPAELREVPHEAEARQRRGRFELPAVERGATAERDAARAVDEEDGAVHGAQDLEADVRRARDFERLGPTLERP